MKLMIDTDSDNIKLQCNGFYVLELCQALDGLLEEVAEELDADADDFKAAFIVTFMAAIKARKEIDNDNDGGGVD